MSKSTTKMILEKIKGPEDLRALEKGELSALCQEIRKKIISVTAENGGHVGPNLGVVELTVALHLTFDAPNDSFVWDVSHQGYVHKLLTGRNDKKFDKIRSTDGYSGFLCRDESDYDCYGAGHAGTALSAALGMCVARDLKKEKNNVVAIAGDAAFTCGITLEALNNIAANTNRFILVLNDNEWSIAKNVGAFSKYFNDLITNPIYTKVHKDAEQILQNVPGGPSLIKFLSKAKRDTKELLAPSSIFEKLGVRYLGPIDGHNLEDLVDYLEFAKASEEPIVLHILTKKGKGFPVAMEEPEKWHGTGPFNPTSGKAKQAASPKALKYQDVFGSSLCDAARKDKKIVAITAAMPSGTGLSSFSELFPSRFFDVGIAEEHAVLMASGMAAKGLRPVCAIYSTFLQRAYDQIIHDVCLQNLPVTFCLDRAGLSPNDGPTHHGVFDLSFLRCIPNAVIMQPKDERELQSMLLSCIYSNRPCFLRYPRGTGSGIPLQDSPVQLEIGKAEVVMEGSDICFWTLGNFVDTAIELSEYYLSEFGLSCTVVNARFAKPLDMELLRKNCHDHKLLITLEDNVLSGGFGSSILEEVNQLNCGLSVIRFGWPDEFIQHGSSVDEIRNKHFLDLNSIKLKISDTIRKKFSNSISLCNA